MTDRQFAKDVAKELDRRQRRRKVLVLGGGIVAIVLAVLYARCGGGWGLGDGAGSGSGAGPGSGSAAAVMAKRCEVRVAKTGITVENQPAKVADVVTACKKTGAADVVVTGDAREGDWDELRKALEAAKVDISLRRPR